MDAKAERERLLQIDAEWSALSNAGSDVDGIVSYWSEDAIVYPPGFPPVVGRAAIRDYVAASLTVPGFSIAWQADDARLSEDGTLAYTTGTNTVSMTGEDGSTQTQTGRVVTVWRREPSGDWRCVIDIWNGA
jgi:ketosteroid isomerase-like protein